jgi:hypothetical protein
VKQQKVGKAEKAQIGRERHQKAGNGRTREKRRDVGRRIPEGLHQFAAAAA